MKKSLKLMMSLVSVTVLTACGQLNTSKPETSVPTSKTTEQLVTSQATTKKPRTKSSPVQDSETVSSEDSKASESILPNQEVTISETDAVNNSDVSFDDSSAQYQLESTVAPTVEEVDVTPPRSELSGMGGAHDLTTEEKALLAPAVGSWVSDQGAQLTVTGDNHISITRDGQTVAYQGMGAGIQEGYSTLDLHAEGQG